MLKGKPFSVMAFTVRDRKIAEINILREPERLSQLDLTVLDGYAVAFSDAGRNMTVSFKGLRPLRLSRTPRSHAREAARRDAGHESRSIAEFRRREVCVRSHVDASETLKQRYRTAFGDTGVAVDYEVFL